MIFNMQQGGVVPDQYLDEQTITPGTADQVISAGTYLRGSLTIVGDADLIPTNIKNGVNIFGVEGLPTYGLIYDKVNADGYAEEITIKGRFGGATGFDLSHCNKIIINEIGDINNYLSCESFVGKIKVKSAKSIQNSAFSRLCESGKKTSRIFVDKSIPTLSSLCFSCGGYFYSSGKELVVYTNAQTKLDGWADDFNQVKKSNTSRATLTVMYGVTEEQFDNL